MDAGLDLGGQGFQAFLEGGKVGVERIGGGGMDGDVTAAALDKCLAEADATLSGSAPRT